MTINKCLFSDNPFGATNVNIKMDGKMISILDKHGNPCFRGYEFEAIQYLKKLIDVFKQEAYSSLHNVINLNLEYKTKGSFVTFRYQLSRLVSRYACFSGMTVNLKVKGVSFMA